MSVEDHKHDHQGHVVRAFSRWYDRPEFYPAPSWSSRTSRINITGSSTGRFSTPRDQYRQVTLELNQAVVTVASNGRTVKVLREAAANAQGADVTRLHVLADEIEKQIPKPKEPHGKGSVVLDREGSPWTRFRPAKKPGPHWINERGACCYWADIDAVEVTRS